jgi:hypothetical protein
MDNNDNASLKGTSLSPDYREDEVLNGIHRGLGETDSLKKPEVKNLVALTL